MAIRDLRHVSNFGSIDADADTLLAECFEDHPSYLSVIGGQSFLVLGRKGSGKTAIYKRILGEGSYNRLAEGYTFDDYPWHHHELQEETGVPEERRYIHSWKYLILLSVAKTLLNRDSSQPWSQGSVDALGLLESFVVDTYGSRDPDLASLFVPGRQLKMSAEFNLRIASVRAEKIDMRDLPVHIQAVNRAIQECVIECLNPEIDYFVCFDQLDLGFDPAEPKYSQRLKGLLIGARDIFVAAKAAGKLLSPTVFLRDDIYQDLKFEDKNKISENFSTEIVWKAEGEGLTLRDLMEARFRTVLGADEAGGGVQWDDIFEEEESARMPSRQTKYRHICDRTFLRPRDMIRFCNGILQEHAKSPSSTGRFGNESIHNARDSYSNYLLNEIDDEISKHVPRYKDYLEVIKSIGNEKFDLEEFVEKYSVRLDALIRSKAVPADAVVALEQLFDFSVISYLKPGGRGGGSEYVWRYLDSRTRFDSTAKSFRVHPGFKEVLGLTR